MTRPGDPRIGFRQRQAAARAEGSRGSFGMRARARSCVRHAARDAPEPVGWASSFDDGLVVVGCPSRWRGGHCLLVATRFNTHYHTDALVASVPSPRQGYMLSAAVLSRAMNFIMQMLRGRYKHGFTPQGAKRPSPTQSTDLYNCHGNEASKCELIPYSPRVQGPAIAPLRPTKTRWHKLP